MKVAKEFKIRECEPSLAEFIEDRKNRKALELKALSERKALELQELSEQSEEQEIMDYRCYMNNCSCKVLFITRSWMFSVTIWLMCADHISLNISSSICLTSFPV